MSGWLIVTFAFVAFLSASSAVFVHLIERSCRERSRLSAQIRQEQVDALTEDDRAWLDAVGWQA